MSREIAVFVNPTAGRGRGLKAASVAADLLRARGLTPHQVSAPGAEEGIARLRAVVRKGVHAVVAVGGDGTVAAALQAVAGTSTPLGVIPIGSGNDFARALDLPLGDVVAATHVVADLHPRDVDLGRVGERWFGTILCSGFDSRVNERANRMTWAGGRTRYNAALVGELGALAPVPYELELDGKPFDVGATLIAVGNSRSYGGGMRMCPDADLSDGLFDVTVVAECGRAELLRVLPKVYSGRHVSHPKVSVHRAATVSLTARGLSAWADGERLGALPITADCVPAAVRVLVPEVWG
ncbi:diacylglycerol kinase [Streptomyces sp. SID3343]|uniref:diacylglycerol kinase n=1 Tax=Streptomyces sp. SID3343 TaxID=2690260 RepID=UPI001371FCD6|nr:diacylglycerol kinase [Streptomyces sp. SID3343]